MRIKKFRQLRGWSQSEFAERLHKDVGTISRWERGIFPAHMDRRLREISAATGAPMRWLSHGEGDPASVVESLGVAESLKTYAVAEINIQILTQALDLVLQELQRRKATLPPSKIAAAVVEIYNLTLSHGKKDVEIDNVTPFVNLLLAR